MSRLARTLAEVAPPPPAGKKPDPGLTPEDQKVLDALELLLDLELLEGWDPKEDLPIPVEPVSGPPEPGRQR